MKKRLSFALLLALLGAPAAKGENATPLNESLPAESPESLPAEDESPLEEGPLGEDPPTFSDEAEAVLVEVPVEVLADGRPVEGLTADDFEVFDNGRRQRILGLDAVDRRHSRYDSDLPVVARRHFLLLFDLSFTSPAAVARAREAALRTVESQLDPSDLVGVATFRLQEGVRLLLGFSPDRSQVRVTLDALERKTSIALRPDPLNLYLGQPASAESGVKAPLRPDTAAQREEAYAPLQHLIDRESAARSRRDVALLSESLSSLARLMRGAAGRKHLILFSEGFAAGLLHGSGGADREALDRAVQAGDLAKVDSDALFGSRATIDLLNRLTEEMRRADCSLHTVDTSPLGQSQGKDGLFLLARDTGAVFFENFNQLGGAFEQLLRRTQLTYVLTYRPEDLKGDGSYRKLKVKLAGEREAKNVKLSYRPGYYDDEVASFAKEERRLLLADRLLDRRPGAIRTRVHAMPTGDLVHGKNFVPVVVEVGGPSFLGPAAAAGRSVSAAPDAPRQVVLDAQVFVYALTEDGGIADFFSQAIPFDLARHGPALQRRGFKLFAPLLLPAGRFTLKALVRNGERGRIGVASKNLQVAKKAGALRVPAALVDPEWLLVRADRSDLDDLGPDRDPLELLRKAQFQPSERNPEAVERPNESSEPYRRALAAFGEKPWHEALDALEAFEVQTVGSDAQNRAPRLGRGELAAARALSQKDSEVLWPLLAAHHDLYFRHRKGHRAYLELQSRQQVRSLAELAAERGDDGLRLAASAALSSIGSTLLYEGRAAGFELLERSLVLDPLNEPAHLSLAAYYEKFGGPYERAVEWLDQLVLRRPDSREGRLRLAINLLRLEGSAAAAWPLAREDAAHHFERLIADPQNDWISSLAVQELARLQRDRPEEAAAGLEEALARRPDDAEIRIQLTYLYDRLGRAEKSRALAEELAAGAAGAAGETGASPRGKYNHWSSEALGEARRTLLEGAMDRIGVLRTALSPPTRAARAAPSPSIKPAAPAQPSPTLRSPMK